MKSIPSLIRAMLVLALATTAFHTRVHADDDLMVRYIFRQFLMSSGQQHFASLIYDEPFDEYTGRAGLRLTAPPFFKVENDADGLPARVISDVMELIIRPSEEEWTGEDPQAFDIVVRDIGDGLVMRKATVARIHRDEIPIIISRTIDYGRRIEGTKRTTIPEGRVTRREFTSPELGIGIFLTGVEVEGRFNPGIRSIFMKYRHNEFQRVHRTRDEARCPHTGDWVMTSDLLRERQNLRGRWVPVLEIHDPEGEAIREEWDYYTYGEKSGPDGYTDSYRKVKRHLQKDGTEIRYQYFATGTIMEIHDPDGTVRSVTKLDER